MMRHDAPARAPQMANTTMPRPTLDDAWHAFTSGQTASLGAIYDAVADELYGLALWRTGTESDAADAVQNVFVKLATTRARLARVRQPRAYLLTMTRRAAIDLLRKRPRQEPLDDQMVEDDGPDPRRTLDATTATKALRVLKPKLREAVYLRHYAGLTFREMARVLDVPTFTAASRYRAGVDKLRRHLGVTP